MKVLDTRHTSGEVVLMTWSPRMDLLAIVNSNCDVILYRLSWQKVWTIGNNLERGSQVKKETPLFLTWHPEGISVILGFSNDAVIIDTELGQIIHSHKIKELVSCNWILTQYQPCFKEFYEREKRDQFTMAETPTTVKLETNLCFLLLGTKSQEVYVYTGSGILFTLILKIETPYQLNVLKFELTPDLYSIQLLNRITIESGEMLALSCYKSELLPTISEVLGAAGIKLMHCKGAVRALEEELLSINDNWKKISDIYLFYMTYSSMSEILGAGEKIADYVELLVTGAASIEMELFLGAGGREKEAKRNITTIQTAKTAIRENCTNVKEHVTFLINELQEFDGIFKLISEKQDGQDAVRELQELYGTLFLACVQIQHMLDKFVQSFMHFLTLIINTIQTYNQTHHEAPEGVEEECDPDKVWEFFRMSYNSNIFRMITFKEILGKKNSNPVSFKNLPNIIKIEQVPPTNPKYKEWLSFSKFIEENNTILKQPFDVSDSELHELLLNFTERLDEKWNQLFQIPILNSPTDHEFFVLNCFPDRIQSVKSDETGITYDPVNALTYVCHKEFSNPNDSDINKKLWIYQCNLNEEIPSVSTVLVQFNLPIRFVTFFSSISLTLLFYESNSMHQDHGRVTLVQFSLDCCFENSKKRGLRIPKGTTAIEKWNDLYVKIPTDILSPSLTPNPYIQSLLVINDLRPEQMAVSGQRKVGCILSSTKKNVYLLDMENESKDDSEADTTINSVMSDTD